MKRLALATTGLILILSGGWLGYTLMLRSVPPVHDLAARVHARLARNHDPYTPIAAIPPILQRAEVATEDERFYSHHGIDLLGLARAAFDDLRRHCLCEGGSTITEQLAKQIYLGGSDSPPTHKIESMILALKIEQHYSKQQILEFYFNTAYYGHHAYGVGAATEAYWSIAPAQVNLSQAAMLAGLPQAPSDYDPLEHPAAARQRRDEVLNLLVQAGVTTEAKADAMSTTPLTR